MKKGLLLLMALSFILIFGATHSYAAREITPPACYYGIKDIFPDVKKWQETSSNVYMLTWGGLNYMIGVDRTHQEKKAKGSSLEMFGAEGPALIGWYDDNCQKLIAFNQSRETMEIGYYVDFEVISNEISPPHGIIRIKLYAEDQRLVAFHDFVTFLIPVPSPLEGCETRELPWTVDGQEIGFRLYWQCQEAKKQITELYSRADFEIVFQTWNIAGKSYAAITLDTPSKQRVAAEVYDDKISMLHFAEDEEEKKLVIRLIVDGKLYQRTIGLPKTE